MNEIEEGEEELPFSDLADLSCALNTKVDKDLVGQLEVWKER